MFSSLTPVSALIMLTVVTLLLILIAKQQSSRKRPASDGSEGGRPYRLRADWLSEAERGFYHLLCGIVGDDYRVMAKVNLGDLFHVGTVDHSKRTSYRNRIDRKHVDFLICGRDSLEPRLAVELDDSSHRRARRAERDAFVDQVFSAAGLALARFPLREQYNTTQIDTSVRQALAEPERTESVYADSDAGPGGATASRDQGSASPVIPHQCPTCGSPMVLRKASRGAHRGKAFWGCTAYPRCKTIIQETDVATAGR